MNPEDEQIKERADEFARKHKKSFAQKFTDVAIFLLDKYPVSVFMAGSPGAGKTESSVNLVKKLSKDNRRILRIDSDDLRKEFAEYNGKNSSLFIGATSIVVEKIHDLALSQKQSFIFDGTLSNLGKSRENIERSIHKDRFVQIVYVYQDPKQAWEFVIAREKKDGRKIPKDAFINEYFLARNNVNILKAEFGKQIQVDLVVKNIDGTDFSYHENIAVIDHLIPEKYTKEDLDKIITP